MYGVRYAFYPTKGFIRIFFLKVHKSYRWTFVVVPVYIKNEFPRIRLMLFRRRRLNNSLKIQDKINIHV